MSAAEIIVTPATGGGLVYAIAGSDRSERAPSNAVRSSVKCTALMDVTPAVTFPTKELLLLTGGAGGAVGAAGAVGE